MKIVVSRYNEDIEWTKPFGEHIVLYNKGEDTIDGAIVLPNVGREGHTYFHYICENYDCLDDYTVFLQGNPFDHSPNVCSQLHRFLNEQMDCNIDFQYLDTSQITFNLIHGCYCHPNLPIARVYETLFEKAATNRDIRFNPGAQFIVSKERIRKRPKAFYQKIVDMLGYHSGPDEGYVIERFHPLIFGDE
jgi:hypothetical protein